MPEKRSDEKLERLEGEVKEELHVKGKGRGEMTTHEAGEIGGQMVKRLVEEGKEREAEGSRREEKPKK